MKKSRLNTLGLAALRFSDEGPGVLRDFAGSESRSVLLGAVEVIDPVGLLVRIAPIRRLDSLRRSRRRYAAAWLGRSRIHCVTL